MVERILDKKTEPTLTSIQVANLTTYHESVADEPHDVTHVPLISSQQAYDSTMARLTPYKKIRALGDSGFVSTLSQDSIMTLLKKGIDKDMKSFAEKLSPEEMKAVAGYIKELAGKRQGS